MNGKKIRRSFCVFVLVLASLVAGVADESSDNLGEVGKSIHKLMVENHYLRKTPDDELSKEWLRLYLNRLDPGGRMLSKEIRRDLFTRFATVLDDALLAGDVSPAMKIHEVLKEQVRKRSAQLEVELSDELVEEVKKEQAREGLDREEATTRVLERYQRLMKKILIADEEAVFDGYMTAFVQCYDGRCEYFSPMELEQIRFSGSWMKQVGIGALLRMTNEGWCRIEGVVRTSPAKRGELEAGDLIIAIAQGEEGGDFIDVAYRGIDDVVSMIRGRENSRMRLKIVPFSDPDTVQIVAIQRVRCSLDELRAEAKVIDIGGRKVGWVEPGFSFDDFGEGDTPCLSKDLVRLFTKFFKQDVEGVVLDLRGKSGGSLREALNSASLFLGNQPVVRTRAFENGELETHSGDRETALYEGALVVIVDAETASAAEMFAGALQDYGRAAIVGGSASRGAGIEKKISRVEGSEETRVVAATVAKYYRPSGKAIQAKGIQPDILVPGGEAQFRGTELPNEIPYDEVESLRGCKRLNFPEEGKESRVPDVRVRKTLKIDWEGNITEIEAESNFQLTKDMAVAILRGLEATALR